MEVARFPAWSRQVWAGRYTWLAWPRRPPVARSVEGRLAVYSPQLWPDQLLPCLLARRRRRRRRGAGASSTHLQPARQHSAVNNGDLQTVRSCAVMLPDQSCTTTDQSSYIHEEYCITCDTDLCNAASPLPAAAAAIFTPLLAALLA